MTTTITPRSRTLLRLEKDPGTVCGACPNALWQSFQKNSKPSVRVYCTLIHALIDQQLMDCDGMPDEEQAQPSATAEPAKDFGLPKPAEQQAGKAEAMPFL